jgi:hypothetical protein
VGWELARELENAGAQPAEPAASAKPNNDDGGD